MVACETRGYETSSRGTSRPLTKCRCRCTGHVKKLSLLGRSIDCHLQATAEFATRIFSGDSDRCETVPDHRPGASWYLGTHPRYHNKSKDHDNCRAAKHDQQKT